MTHRQFAAWQDWLKEQWTKPDRHDYYVMQNTQSNLGGKGAKPPPLEKLKIPFKFAEPGKPPVGMTDKERRAAISKQAQAVWLHRVGGRVVHNKG